MNTNIIPKKSLRFFGSCTTLLAITFALLTAGWAENRVTAAQSADQPQTKAPAGMADSAEPSSFKQVAAHLDAGGNFFLYLSTEQWLTGLSEKISGIRQVFQDMPNFGSEDRAKLNQVFSVITGLVKSSGVEEVSGVGMSSIAIDKGFYRNKSILHHYPGKNTGRLWSLFGKTPHALAGLDLLPEQTALASFGDFDIPMLWSAIEQEVTRAGIQEATAFFRQFPELFAQQTGVKFDQLMASLGNEYGIVLTLDETKKIFLPLPTGQMQIPEPGLLLVIKVKDNLIFDRLDQLLKDANQQVTSVDKEGLKMRTIQVPLPLPFALRPTIARSGDYLFVATSDSLIQEVMAVKSGDKKGFKATDEFKRLSQGVPLQGNQFAILSKKFGDTLVQVQTEVLKANAAMPAASLTWMQTMLQGNRAASSFMMSGLSEEGWISTGNGTRDMRTAIMAPLVVVPVGLLAAIAVPNFVRARSMAQANVCIANLKQLDGAKEQWALENKKKVGDTVKMSDLVPAYIKNEPRCPVGSAAYILNPIGKNPTCPNHDESNSDLSRHKLPN